MKENDYLCPSCKGHLNAGGKVVFTTKNSRNKKGLILLSPEIGGYTYEHHENNTFEKGEIVLFSCPICSTELTSTENDKFAEITMIDHNNMDYRVLFSRTTGVKSTYVVSNENIEAFGEDVMSFDDVF